MKIIQIGHEDWSQDLELPEDLEWLHTKVEDLPQLLETLKQIELDKLVIAEGEEIPKIRLNFNGVLLTDYVEETEIEILDKMIEAYSLFYSPTIRLGKGQPRGIFRRKMIRPLEVEGSKLEKILFLHRNLFPSQYGAKLKIPDIDINPNFSGNVEYNGHVRTAFTGDFGEDFNPLFTFRYNLSSFPCSLELWLEYVKMGNASIQMSITPLRKGTLGDLLAPIILGEDELAEPYVLPASEEVGFYSVSVFAKGNGSLEFGPLHWRYSRTGLGQFVLGGQRYHDSKRQEFIYYFNPGDMKPPLNVYFSGFRAAEGFEGFYMMKSLGAPFMLIGDPRLEGGSFYAGTEELENKVQEVIQESLDYLGFEKSQLTLSGLSMGTFGALYYASHFNPGAVIVGKPFVNIGTSAAGMKLTRPDEFETSADILRNLTGRTNDKSILDVNQKFWDKFNQSDFTNTQFAISYMQSDDYDPGACEELIEHLADKDSHIYAKGYSGRHNDNSSSINKWFKTQYKKILGDLFERGKL